MFRTKKIRAIDARARDIIRATQWFPLPMTIAKVAQMIVDDMATAGIVVSFEQACKRTEKVYRRMKR